MAAPLGTGPLGTLESVRCLECGDVYAKPVGGSTARRNPGCPACGYLGWIPLRVPGPGAAPRRRAAGRLRPLSARRG